MFADVKALTLLTLQLADVRKDTFELSTSTHHQQRRIKICSTTKNNHFSSHLNQYPSDPIIIERSTSKPTPSTMMTFRLLSLIAVLAVASAFSTPGQGGVVSRASLSSSSSLSMAIGDTPAPLQEQGDALEVVEATDVDPWNVPKKKYANLGKGEEVKEVNWVDPAMAANTNPFLMSWWAYIFFGFPFILLADDAFHFIPHEGPLAFLGKF